ncbi:MAG TPA: amidohydrolase family protein [Anaerolineae bacterium]|nr:amidohydrolase family protein [Anaerolineae bacterium]HPL29382.1 amidohydrolase family protein [Anaerolineae bacterium]
MAQIDLLGDVGEIIDLDAVAGSWPQRRADISVGRLLSMMDRHGVGRACTVSARGILYDDAEGNAETLAWCRDNPRLIPVGTIDLRKFAGYRAEIARLNAAGVRLWRLFPEHQGWTFELATFRRVLSALEDAGAVLFVSGQPSAVARAVAGARLPVILGVHFYQMADLLATLEEGAGLCISTRLLHGPGVLGRLVQAMGHERIVFGSGAPLASLGSALGCIAAARLPAEQRAAILGGNLRRLLGVGDDR